MYYYFVFPKVKCCVFCILISPVTSPLNTKRSINSIKTKFSQMIFTSIFWKPFSEISTSFCSFFVYLKLYGVTKFWVFKILRKFQRGTTIIAAVILWLQSPSQVVTQSPILLAATKIETKQYQDPIAGIAPFKTPWVKNIDYEST